MKDLTVLEVRGEQTMGQSRGAQVILNELDLGWEGAKEMPDIASDEVSQDDRRKELATGGLEMSLRELTANLLRITRGSGHPHRLPDQLAELQRVFSEYRQVFEHWPSAETVAAMLRVDGPTVFEDGHRDDSAEAEILISERARDLGVVRIRRASLQIVASSLLNQNLQLNSAEEEFWSAFKATGDADEALGKARARARQVPRRAKRRRIFDGRST